MPILIVFAAVAVAASIPLLWWSVSSARPANRAAVENLVGGYRGVADLREAVLTRAGRRGIHSRNGVIRKAISLF